MVLIPSPNAPDTRPKYHISVRMNCFIPSSYITTIRRGATQEGAMVGDFEMGIADKTATLFIRGKEFPIGDVLGKSGSRRGGLWDWKFVKHVSTFNTATQESATHCYYAGFILGL